MMTGFGLSWRGSCHLAWPPPAGPWSAVVGGHHYLCLLTSWPRSRCRSGWAALHNLTAVAVLLAQYLEVV